MKTVLAHGVFDVIHAGHLAYFRAAKKFGDRLVVSVTTDRYVNKGPGRPYFTTAVRADMLKSLSIVDEVIISDSPTAVESINRIKPDFYVKGPDYKDFSKDVTGGILKEKAAVEKHDGQLVFTDEEMFSSSNIINRFFQGWSDEQKAVIERVNSLGGEEHIRKIFERMETLQVCVLGEPILDVYRFCNPEGISSKSPSISARFSHEETYPGGTWAIAKHLKTFCKVAHHYPLSYPIPRKIRYISPQGQRMFEVTEIDDTQRTEFYGPPDCDIVILADFGHGLVPPMDLHLLGCKFVALNVQANSSNFGFNTFKKHSHWNYLCIDKRELQLGFNDRGTHPNILAQRLSKDCGTVGVTLGQSGSGYFDKDGWFSLCPAFTDNIVDATGAGDAYFAITSLLVYLGCEPEIITFVGNVFAGLKTKIIGNKSAVTKAQLLKACAGILK
jgi:rfaE bifunctional protein nucleotidyltransferase chain/domain